MTDSTGSVPYGSYIELSDGGGTPVFSKIANVVDIQGLEELLEMVDATHLQSTSGHRERRPNLRDTADVTFTCHFDITHATHGSTTGLRYLQINRIKREYRIVYGAMTKRHRFSAYVARLGRQIPLDGNMIQMDVTLSITNEASEETVS
jgi:hypothetical protein